MPQLELFVLFSGLLGATTIQVRPARASLVPARRAYAETSLVVPAGSRILARLAEPLLARSARPGDTIYLRLATPLLVADQTVIDSGSFVEATVSSAPQLESSGRIDMGLRLRRVVSRQGDVADVFAVNPAPNDSAYRRGVAAVADLPGRDQVVTMGASIAVVVNGGFTVDTRRSLASALGRRVRLGGSPPRIECLVQSMVPTPDIRIPGTPATPPIGDTPGSPGTPDIVIPGVPRATEFWQPCQ